MTKQQAMVEAQNRWGAAACVWTKPPPYLRYVTKLIGRYADAPVSDRVIEGISSESWEVAFSQADRAARSFQMNRGIW